jgi:hypothetical protein
MVTPTITKQEDYMMNSEKIIDELWEKHEVNLRKYLKFYPILYERCKVAFK